MVTQQKCNVSPKPSTESTVWMQNDVRLQPLQRANWTQPIGIQITVLMSGPQEFESRRQQVLNKVLHPCPKCPQELMMGQVLECLQQSNSTNYDQIATLRNKIKDVYSARMNVLAVIARQKRKDTELLFEVRLNLEEIKIFKDRLQHIRTLRLRESGAILDANSLNYEQLLGLQDQMGSVSKGLPPQLIHTMTHVVFQKNTTPCDLRCSICQEEFEDNKMLIRLKCNHYFDQECLSQWLALNKVCPICKVEVL